MKGIAKVRGQVKILLDLDRVLGVDGTIAMPQPTAA
jgi:chemotaxis signal transduction protein